MLRKNTAGQNLTFCLVNSSTGTAVTGASVTARRSIDGAAQAAAGGSVSELGNGQYNFAPSAADTNGDLIGYLFTATSAIPVNLAVRTTAADLADAVRLGLTALPNAAAGATGGLPTGDGSGRVLLQPTQTGVTIPTVTAVTNRVTANADQWNGVTVTGMPMPTYTQPTGFLAATFPATVASTTNITAGTITTVTTLTNLPSIPANWLTAAGVAAGALNGKGDWLTAAGYTAPLDAAGTAGAVWNAATASYGTAGTYGLLVETNLDAAVSTRLATAGYTAPDNATVALIHAKTGQLAFTAAGCVDANTLRMNSATVLGTGASGDKWRG